MNLKRLIYFGIAPVLLLAVCFGIDTTKVFATFTSQPYCSTPFPITEMTGTQVYCGLQGGLYPSRTNNPPSDVLADGNLFASSTQLLNRAGNVDSGGKIVLLSIGISNATQEWCDALATMPCNDWSLIGTSTASTTTGVNQHDLVILNGALASQEAASWATSTAANYLRIANTVLPQAGVTPLQVQAVWLKVADLFTYTGLPDDLGSSTASTSADAYVLEGYMGDIVRSLKVNYPNLKTIFITPRIYGGWATTIESPEPYAYEAGFATKWLIGSQISQMRGAGPDPIAGNLRYSTTSPSTAIAPFITWGPYIWATSTPRADGLVWDQSDFSATDGTHPSISGETKVANQLIKFFESSPYSSWFNSHSSNTRSLDVIRGGTGYGASVTSDDGGINCGTSCWKYYNSATAVVLTENPGSYTTFGGWYGPDAGNCAGSTSPTCSVTVNADKYIIPVFNPILATLTATTSGTGAGSITNDGGINCSTFGTSTCSISFPEGATTTFSVFPNASSHFDSWTGACAGVSSSSNCTLFITGTTNMGAKFDYNSYTLTVGATSSSSTFQGGGTITSSPGTINCGSICSNNFAYNSVVTLTATPTSTATFGGWSGAGPCNNSTSTTCVLTITGDNTIFARFDPLNYTISATTSGSGAQYGKIQTSSGGSIGGPINCGSNFNKCNATYDPGSIVTATSSSPSGQASFLYWAAVPNGCVTTLPWCTFTITGPVTLNAVFSKNTLLTATTTGAGTVVSADGGINCGSGHLNCSEYYSNGISATLIAQPNFHQNFLGWGGDCGFAGTSTSCNLTMSADKNVSASFSNL